MLLISNPIEVKYIDSDFHILWGIGAILLITIIIAYIFGKFINKYIKQKFIAHEKDITTLQFAKHIIVGIIYLIGIATALSLIPALKTLGHSLLAGAGILSVIVGLATQQSLGNLFGGLMIVIFKPLRINDRVTIKGHSGYVEDITLRQVVIRDFYNNRIIFPNSVVNSEIIMNNQMTDTKTCKHLEFRIGYSSSIDKAMELMQDEAMKHPLLIDNRTDESKANNAPIVKTKVISINDSSITIRAWVWSDNSTDASTMYYDLLKSIKERFDTEGIEMPFPQRTISYVQERK